MQAPSRTRLQANPSLHEERLGPRGRILPMAQWLPRVVTARRNRVQEHPPKPRRVPRQVKRGQCRPRTGCDQKEKGKKMNLTAPCEHATLSYSRFRRAT